MGIGYDVHVLSTGKPLILGGVAIPHSKGLSGHSDADVLMHAVCDAVLGAIGEKDIGQFFPDSDPRWKGANSRMFLEEARRQVQFHRGVLVNVDATVIAECPRLSPFVLEMKRNIAEVLELRLSCVGVKATTNEGIGFLGRGEGIAAMAVAGVDVRS